MKPCKLFSLCIPDRSLFFKSFLSLLGDLISSRMHAILMFYDVAFEEQMTGHIYSESGNYGRKYMYNTVLIQQNSNNGIFFTVTDQSLPELVSY